MTKEMVVLARLSGAAFAPYKRFVSAKGRIATPVCAPVRNDGGTRHKTLMPGQFICPEQMKKIGDPAEHGSVGSKRTEDYITGRFG